MNDELKNLREENDNMINETVMLKAKVNRLERENEQLKEENKAFDEVRKYVLNNHNEFEDRKDRARSNKEFDYFNTLQIANKAVINKCKQLDEN